MFYALCFYLTELEREETSLLEAVCWLPFSCVVYLHELKRK